MSDKPLLSPQDPHVETGSHGAASGNRPVEPAPDQVNRLETKPLRPIDPDPAEVERRLRFVDAIAARLPQPVTGKKVARSRATKTRQSPSQARRRR
jgi:hypothetical protein